MYLYSDIIIIHLSDFNYGGDTFLTVDGEMHLCGEEACYNSAIILNCLMPSSLPYYFVTCTSQFPTFLPRT